MDFACLENKLSALDLNDLSNLNLYIFPSNIFYHILFNSKTCSPVGFLEYICLTAFLFILKNLTTC